MGLSILIADDEGVVRNGIAKYIQLHSDRFEQIYLARNGQEALDLILQYHPDMALMDVKMPLLSGLEVLRQAKEAGTLPVTIIVSGFDDFKYAQQALRVGARDYLIKPTASSEILEKVLELADATFGKPDDVVTEDSAEEKNVIVVRAEKYLREHYFEKVTLSSTAEQLSVSPSYLSMIFSKQIGETFIDRLNRIRIEHACAYLMQNQLKTYEIAFKVGYRDEKYFTKVFHKLMGMSPSEYRRRGGQG